MDAQDAQKINNQIETLNNNLHNITDTIGRQDSINLQSIQKFRDITNHINKEQITIKSFLETTGNKIKRDEDIVKEMQYLNQINFNIDLLTDHISDITESLVLSKLNIIPKFLLNDKEIKLIYNKLKDQDIQISSTEQLYELLKLQGYYNETNIIFNVLIPNFSNSKFNMYHIIPLPINDTKIVTTEYFITHNDHNIQYFSTLCPKTAGTYICSQPKLEEETATSPCMGKLMENKVAHCTLDDVGRLETISQPEPNFILFINVPQVSFNSSCRTKTGSIKGTALMHFRGCNVEINGVTYEDDPMISWDDIHLLPTSNNKIFATKVNDVVNFEKLKEFNSLTESRFQTLTTQTEILHHLSISSSTITILFGAIVFILLVVILKRRRSAQLQLTNLHPFAPAPMTSLWPSLYSKGGGVTPS